MYKPKDTFWRVKHRYRQEQSGEKKEVVRAEYSSIVKNSTIFYLQVMMIYVAAVGSTNQGANSWESSKHGGARTLRG